MKKTICLLAALALCLAGCGAPVQEEISVTEATAAPEEVVCDGTEIVLSDSGITVDGQAVSQDTAQPVYTANDIVYYEEGHDFTYGEGTARDAHSVEEAAAHTVVHITQPGTYILSGSLSKGQVAVDLGDGAEEDPNAVVTLVLDGVDITCSVAPALFSIMSTSAAARKIPPAPWIPPLPAPMWFWQRAVKILSPAAMLPGSISRILWCSAKTAAKWKTPRNSTSTMPRFTPKCL